MPNPMQALSQDRQDRVSEMQEHGMEVYISRCESCEDVHCTLRTGRIGVEGVSPDADEALDIAMFSLHAIMTAGEQHSMVFIIPSRQGGKDRHTEESLQQYVLSRFFADMIERIIKP